MCVCARVCVHVCIIIIYGDTPIEAQVPVIISHFFPFNFKCGKLYDPHCVIHVECSLGETYR